MRFLIVFLDNGVALNPARADTNNSRLLAPVLVVSFFGGKKETSTPFKVHI